MEMIESSSVNEFYIIVFQISNDFQPNLSIWEKKKRTGCHVFKNLYRTLCLLK